MNIGEFIRKQRISNGLTQTDLGKLLNVANTTISNYENGISMPDINMFMNLSKIFRTCYVPTAALFDTPPENCVFFEKVYVWLCNYLKPAHKLKLDVIPVNPKWRYKNTDMKKAFFIIDSNPENLCNNSLVIAPVPEGEEHIYRIKYYCENTYLMPESGPPYITTVKINRAKIHLRKIIAIIQYP